VWGSGEKRGLGNGANAWKAGKREKNGGTFVPRAFKVRPAIGVAKKRSLTISLKNSTFGWVQSVDEIDVARRVFRATGG